MAIGAFCVREWTVSEPVAGGAVWWSASTAMNSMRVLGDGQMLVGTYCTCVPAPAHTQSVSTAWRWRCVPASSEEREWTPWSVPQDNTYAYTAPLDIHTVTRSEPFVERAERGLAGTANTTWLWKRSEVILVSVGQSGRGHWPLPMAVLGAKVISSSFNLIYCIVRICWCTSAQIATCTLSARRVLASTRRPECVGSTSRDRSHMPPPDIETTIDLSCLDNRPAFLLWTIGLLFLIAHLHSRAFGYLRSRRPGP